MFDVVPASRRYPCVLIVLWRLATKICPLRASLARLCLFAFCVTGPSWPPLAVFFADRGAKSATERCRSEAGGMCCVSGRVRCTNGQGQAPRMGENGTNINMSFYILNHFYINQLPVGAGSSQRAVAHHRLSPLDVL